MRSGGEPGELDPLTAAMVREKRYRELIPMTHEQYLDEPWDVIEWTLRIDNLQREFRHGGRQSE